MSVQKILIDYSEYTRLREIEQRYETLLKSGQQGAGNIAAEVQKTEEENTLRTPLVTQLPPITLPASSTPTPTPTSTSQTMQKKESKEEKPEPWYFLGKPTAENEKFRPS